jgi:hypothetical protein
MPTTVPKGLCESHVQSLPHALHALLMGISDEVPVTRAMRPKLLSRMFLGLLMAHHSALGVTPSLPDANSLGRKGWGRLARNCQ